MLVCGPHSGKIGVQDRPARTRPKGSLRFGSTAAAQRTNCGGRSGRPCRDVVRRSLRGPADSRPASVGIPARVGAFLVHRILVELLRSVGGAMTDTRIVE